MPAGVIGQVPAFFSLLAFHNNYYLLSPPHIFYVYLYLDLFRAIGLIESIWATLCPFMMIWSSKLGLSQ